MKIIRFVSGGQVHHGIPDGPGQARLLAGGIPGGFNPTDRRVKVDRLLAPLVPVDILCIGLNYRAHAEEQGSKLPERPVLFIKSSNTLNDPGAPIVLPPVTQQVDYEVELAVVIGRDARRVGRERALEHVLGYTVANDVSCRDYQMDKAINGGQWAKGKCFDGFCPLGPTIVTADEIPDPDALRMRTRLNGEVMQEGTTADMIFDVRTLIAHLSETMTLRAGSVLLTGTPPGVGFARKPQVFLRPGDRVEVEVEGIGTLVNPVTAG